MPTEESLKLLREWEAAKSNGISFIDFAIGKGKKPKSLEIRIYRARRELKFRDEAVEEIVEIDIGQPLRLNGDYMIVGDVHIPSTDWGLAMQVAEVAKTHMTTPRRLLIGGDFFNMDSFSQYQSIVKPSTWKEEREAAKALIKAWLETFDEIEMILGNHDRRLQKWLNGEFDENDILSLIISDPRKVRMSNFGWCEVESGGIEWRVTHPRNYSINQLVVADALANKYQSNIISFHEHHLGIGWDRYKNWVIVNGGGLFEPEHMAYVKLDDSKSAGMTKGFVMLKDGCPYLFGDPPFTDWRHWLDRKETRRSVFGGLFARKR